MLRRAIRCAFRRRETFSYVYDDAVGIGYTVKGVHALRQYKPLFCVHCRRINVIIIMNS